MKKNITQLAIKYGLFTVATICALSPALAQPHGSYAAPYSCFDGKITVFLTGHGAMLAISKDTNTPGPMVRLEDCQTFESSANDLACRTQSMTLYASQDGNSYIIPSGAHDPFPIDCKYFPPTPSGFSIGN